jgi:ABC-2 type transport system ATP-binding protein
LHFGGVIMLKPRALDVRSAETPPAPGSCGSSFIAVGGLKKRFGDVEAVAGVDLEVGAGEIVGVLGPNGAGKTTLIEIVLGLLAADAGEGQILGRPLGAWDRATRGRLGVVMQGGAVPPQQRVVELVEMFASFYAHPRPTDELIRLVGLEDKRRSVARVLSGGQRQRLSIALALVGDPDLMVLDEPTSELDPQGRAAIWDVLLDEKRRQDRAVLLTTHSMDEAERLCDRVAIMDQGRIIALGSPSSLIDRHCPGTRVRFRTEATAELGLAEAVLTPDPSRSGWSTVVIDAPTLEAAIERLMAARRRRGFAIEELRVERRTLEDVFLTLTGRGMRD